LQVAWSTRLLHLNEKGEWYGKRKQLIANLVEHRSPVGGGIVDQAQARGESRVDPEAVATLIVAALK
jgi:hypothetical protein